MRIQHNIMAMNAYRNYTNNVSAMQKNLEKLSSGYKINRAGDDAAGLAISEKMRAQITGLETAQKNAKDGISLVQTAEGALTEVHDMLNRMVELATQSANGTYHNEVDRAQMQKEVNQLLDDIDRIADSSNFNGIKLLDGTLGLNTDAFEVGDSSAYVPAESAGAWVTSGKVGTPHGDTPVTGAVGEFKVDLSMMESYTLASKKTATVHLTIGSGTVTATIGSAGGGGTQTIKGTAVAAAFNNKTITVDGKNFKITNNAGVLTVKSTEVTASTMKADDVAAFKKLVGGSVSVTATSSAPANITGTPHETSYNHAVEDVTDAVAQGGGGRLGVDIDIGSLIKNGNTLTIDGKTFSFKIAASASAGGASTVIAVDTKKFTTDAAVKREVIRQLSNKDTTKFDIEALDADAGKLHIDLKKGQTVTKASMLKGISGTVKGADAKGANTVLKVTEGALKEGNVISVGDKQFVFKGTGTNGFTSADDLATKLTAAGYKTTTTDGTGDDSGKKILTIEGAAKDADGKNIALADRVSPRILGKGLTLQIGDTADDFNQLKVAVQDMHTKSLGISKLDISTEEAAQKAVQKIKDAINTVSDVRGTLGATQNRLDHTINNLSVMTENIQDAESTIRDVDVAEEMMAYTKNNILIQSAQAMLAQANQVPQGVLQLLQ